MVNVLLVVDVHAEVVRLDRDDGAAEVDAPVDPVNKGFKTLRHLSSHELGSLITSRA